MSKESFNVNLCYTCKGRRYILGKRVETRKSGPLPRIIECPICNGKGHIIIYR